VSPRHNRARRDGSSGSRPGPVRGDEDAARSGADRVEEWSGGDWVVRSVAGGGPAKAYRCPGCEQEIPAPAPHVVAWPADRGGMAGTGPDSRRHWHTACWAARGRRGANVQRFRNAPRYG